MIIYFHAIVPSPLGDILLRAGVDHLVGLYFVGQRDCPDLPGRYPMHPEIFNPAAGVTRGRPTRLLKAMPAESAQGSTGLLFKADSAPKKKMAGSLAADDPLAFLDLQQAETPETAQAVLKETQHELSDYFQNGRAVFDVPQAPEGTAFQRKVWDALLTIGRGETVSYGEVGRRAGLDARYSRAVGAAVGANPISILIPCHRVLAGNRTLNGYGGGLDRKVRLLQIEGLVVQ